MIVVLAFVTPFLTFVLFAVAMCKIQRAIFMQVGTNSYSNFIILLQKKRISNLNLAFGLIFGSNFVKVVMIVINTYVFSEDIYKKEWWYKVTYAIENLVFAFSAIVIALALFPAKPRKMV